MSDSIPADRVVKATSRLAHATRWGQPPEKILEAKLDLKAAHLERAIRKAVAEAPPLTDDQRRQLAALLFPSGGAR